jgi:hypothetical protein
MPATLAERMRRVGWIARIAFFALEGVVLLAVSAMLLRHGSEALPDLRPCAMTTMGCPAEPQNRVCEGSWWSSRPTSCPDR